MTPPPLRCKSTSSAHSHSATFPQFAPVTPFLNRAPIGGAPGEPTWAGLAHTNLGLRRYPGRSSLKYPAAGHIGEGAMRGTVQRTERLLLWSGQVNGLAPRAP